MRNTVIRFGFALAVTSTALGGVVAVVSTPAQGSALANKQYCC